MLAERLYRSGVAGKYGMRVKKNSSRYPLLDLVQDDSDFVYDHNPATPYYSVFNLTLLKSAAVMGGMAFIISLSIWIRARGPNIFDNWVNAGIKAHADPMDGMCTNLAGSLMPGSSQSYATSTWDNCAAGDCGISCPVSPLVVMEVLGFAMSNTEFGNMYWYASTLTAPVAVMSATVALIAAKLYVGRATEQNKKNHQTKLKAFNGVIETAANSSLQAMAMGVFTTRIVWSMAAFATVNRILLREANSMSQALNLYIPDGAGGLVAYPQLRSVINLFNKIANLSSFPADSQLSVIPRWVDGSVQYFSSAIFTGMATLTAGAASSWMYILTNGLWMFHVGLALGALALTRKVMKHYINKAQQPETILPMHAMPVTPAKDSLGLASLKWMGNLLLPFSFSADTLNALSEPKKDLDRRFAFIYQLNNLGTMIGLVFTVLIRMGRPGNLLSKEFFQDSAKNFYGLLFDNFFGEKGVNNQYQQWARESTSTIISYTLSLETMLGYFIYGVGAMVAATTFSCFTAARIWDNYKCASTKQSPQATGPAPVRPKQSKCLSGAVKVAKYGYLKTEHAVLDEGHDAWKYGKAFVSTSLVVLTLISFSMSIHTALDGVCPVNSLPGFWRTITENADVVFDGFPQCGYKKRGLAMGEAVSTAWPLMALGISVVVTKLDVLATMMNFVLHCCNLKKPQTVLNPSAPATPTLAGYKELLGDDAGNDTELPSSSDEASEHRDSITPSPDNGAEHEAKPASNRL
ncbi:MAG: hypothetical protein P1U34_06180 [Coxiellaceae bacterium]|nr:hypothetical protein [Coxiellaceae bacterium]